MAFTGFRPTLFKFLKELKTNNNREWFAENKSRYEELVQQPSLEFIKTFESRLRKISPCFQAVAKKSGGSLMRVYRDTRFSNDKTPYKTNVGIQFRHEMGKDVHCPGFYFHMSIDECFLGAGLWHPDGDSLKKIRAAIDGDRAGWKKARDNKKFCDNFKLVGDSLKTPPRGYEKDHPLIDDLRRKDFIGVEDLTRKQVLADDFIDHVGRSLTTSKPLIKFLCDAIGMPF